MKGASFLLALVASATLSCASAPRPKTAAASAAPAPGACADLRACVLGCASQGTGAAACADQCVATAPAAAAAKYQSVRACSLKACPTQDIGCRCVSECNMPSACAELVDVCTNALEDPFCAANCR